jgi:hypothetical protein
MAVVVMTLLIAGGCEPGAPAAQRPSADNQGPSDSVARVVTSLPLSDTGLTALAAVSPVLAIGERASAATRELSRIVGAVRLRDGSIVVANGATNQLRFYSPEGSLTHAVGGSGDRPGEFGRLDGLRRVDGDTLLAWDSRRNGVDVFAPDGAFVRFVRFKILDPTQVGDIQTPLGRMSDGGFVVPVRRRLSAAGQITRDTVRLYYVTPDGADGQVFLEVLGIDAYTPGGVASDRARWPVPFGRQADVQLWRDTIFVMNELAPEVTGVEPGGRVLVHVRGGAVPRPLTPELWTRFVEDVASRHAAAERAGWRSAVERFVRPPLLPAFRRVHVDERGQIWCEWAKRPGEAVSTWTVFGTDRRAIGVAAAVIGDAEVADISSGHIVVTRTDPGGAESVRVYRPDMLKR